MHQIEEPETGDCKDFSGKGRFIGCLSGGVVLPALLLLVAIATKDRDPKIPMLLLLAVPVGAVMGTVLGGLAGWVLKMVSRKSQAS